MLDHRFLSRYGSKSNLEPSGPAALIFSKNSIDYSPHHSSMARTAVLQTNFREEHLEPAESEIDRTHRIDREVMRMGTKGWIDFGDGYNCSDPVDSRGTNLERLFGVPLTKLELLEIHADRSLMRSESEYVQEQKRSVERAAQEYQEALKKSRFGKPVIERDFKERTAREKRFSDRFGARFQPQDFRLIYGPRILALLAKVR